MGIVGVAYLAMSLPRRSRRRWPPLTFLLYVGVYTPLKRVTPLNTLVGAVPGALPPVIGCARFGASRRRSGLPLPHPVPLADAALPGHRLDVPRRVCPRRSQMLPGVDPAAADRRANGPVLRCPDAGESDAGLLRMAGAALRRRILVPGRTFLQHPGLRRVQSRPSARLANFSGLFAGPVGLWAHDSSRAGLLSGRFPFFGWTEYGNALREETQADGFAGANGKLAIWLFLVTEIMFFTALIGTYLILPARAVPPVYTGRRRTTSTSSSGSAPSTRSC